MVPGSQPASPRLMPRCLVVPQSNTVAEVPRGVLLRGWGAGPALGAHRHSGTDPRNSQRARRVALACEVVREDHITRSKTARGAIADPDFHLPRENKNVLSPGRGVPIAPMVRRKTAEHEGDPADCDRHGHQADRGELALNAGWDLVMLSLEIGELGEAGFDLSLTGFDEFELGELFAERTPGRTGH